MHGVLLHTKRFLHASFQADPRALIEDLVASQNACMSSPEIAEANRAWIEKTGEPRYW